MWWRGCLGSNCWLEYKFFASKNLLKHGSIDRKVYIGLETVLASIQARTLRGRMAISNEIQYASLDELNLDPDNPRLGRENTGRGLRQPKILELMKDWTLDELAVSFMESGFWPHEALLVVEEPLYGRVRKVVVEGNRRLAALKLLHEAVEGNSVPSKWADIASLGRPPRNLFARIPFITIDSREDVDAFLGFRHVTGIAEWRPAEKAEYIAKLVENRKMSYEDVTRRIGSRVQSVRQNYISYRLLLQMEDTDKISTEHVERKFSVLYLSLRTAGAQKYLQIDIKADPKAARNPVPKAKLQQLANFAMWLFGDSKNPPIVAESRQVDRFGRILESRKATEYLERNEKPDFETAFRLAGGDEPELIKLIEKAADQIEIALGRAHIYKNSANFQSAVERVGLDCRQLLKIFPEVSAKLDKSS